jgi:hypothetical protein
MAGSSRVLSIYLIFLAALGPGVYSVSNRNECQKQKLAVTSPTSGGRSVGVVRSTTQATEFSSVFRERARPVRRADNLTAICETNSLDNVGSKIRHNL